MADDLARYLNIFAWKDVEFPGTDATLTFGNDSARHSPYLGKTSIETTGPKAKVVRVRAVLNNGLRGWRGARLFPTVYERLVAALEGDPEGFLTHPTRGVFSAHFDEATEEIRAPDRQGLTLMLSFTEQAGEADLPAGADETERDPGAAILSAAALADESKPAGVSDAALLVEEASELLAFLEDSSRSFAEAITRLDAFSRDVATRLRDPAAAVVDAHPYRDALWSLQSATLDYRAQYAADTERVFVVPTAMSLPRVAALPEVYGDASRAADLVRANAIANPARVPAGTHLIVPE